jgi:hypothetical protein
MRQSEVWLSARTMLNDSQGSVVFHMLRQEGRSWRSNVHQKVWGEGGCLSDEIGNLVGPAERRHMDVPAG